MHLLVVDSSKTKLVRELLDVLHGAGICVETPSARDRYPMLRLPDGTWIHGRRMILKYVEGRRSQSGAS